MRLLWSSRSPFARKVMVAVHELGLVDQVVCERVVVSATTANGAVMGVNPLGQIPTLVLEDGTAVFDSAVIVEMLDARCGGGLVPAGEGRWAALRVQALGDGLMGLNVLRLGERGRGVLESVPHQAAFLTKARAVLDALEGAGPMPWTVGGIAVACALSHLDFRFSGDDWRLGRPGLAAWHAGVVGRPSMVATEFQDVY